jgi:hypothetical protein
VSSTPILREALFGTPPSKATKPSREGVLAAFTDLELNTQAGIAAAALSGTDLDAAMVLVQPLLESAEDAAAAAREAQTFAERDGILLLGATGSGNNVNLSLDTGALDNDHLYRFASPITNTGTLTINGRPVLGPGDDAIATAGTVKAGGEVMVAWKAAGQIFRFVSSANTRIDDVTSLLNSIDVAALRSDVTLTRDPLSPSIEINRSAFGLTTYTNGVRTTDDVPIDMLEAGNSHNLAQGASSIDLSPMSQIAAKLRFYEPTRTVRLDRVAAPGSWASQIVGGQLAPYRAANPGRKPRYVGFCTGMNDAIANIRVGYQGFVGPGNTYGGYEAALEQTIQYVQKTMEAIPIVILDHYPEPFRSLENGRLTVTPETWMQSPVPALLGGYLNMKFSASTDRIEALAGTTPFDLFRQYGNGLLGPGQFICQYRPDGFVGKLYKIATISTEGYYVGVEGTYQIVDGAVVRIADGVDVDLDDGVTQVRSCNFDNETQVVPPLSQALVQRDLGSGTPVTVPWGHYEIYEIARRVTARNGGVLMDWAAIHGRLMTSDALYQTQFPPDANGVRDDFHWPDPGYLLLDSPADRLARDIATGRQIRGNVYD